TLFTGWNSIGFDQIGAPVIAETAATSRFATKANFQTYTNGALYQITSGALTGRVFFLRRAVQELYETNQGPSGFLGLPVAEEVILADGRRRLSFEGGTMEYALNGTPILKNALQAIIITAEDPIRLTAGQTISLRATLQTIAAEFVTDREVFWSTSNGRVATITGTGPNVTLRAIGGGVATITATSEGKSSNRVTVQVAANCCALGEGAPSQALSQTFVDAIQRNRLTIRTPLSSTVRRSGAGYFQEAIQLPSGNRLLITKADNSPIAYVISGATLTAYEAQGGLTGGLGFATSDLSTGLTQRFEFAALAGSPVRTVSGAILTRWLAINAETGLLGPPLTNATNSITFTGSSFATQQFRSGYLFQANTTSARAFLTTGPIAAKHAELGLASGAIGAPLGEEFLSATGLRQEFEGAFLEYSQGTAVRVIDKQRRPSLTVSPSSLLPGGRYRVSVGGFPQGARLRFNLGTSDSFDFTAANGSFVWESVVPQNARPGLVPLRVADSTSPQLVAESSYTVRTLAELQPAISKLSGDTQSGAPSTVLSSPLRVILRDSSGSPLAGIPLRFEASPGASLLNASAVTAPDGTAEVRLRLPASAGVVLLTAEAGGQIATFSARSVEQLIADFPRITQAVSGTLGSSQLPLTQKGSLVAALAANLRFYQQRGVAPADQGLADTTALNAFLRDFCTTDLEGRLLCDGFLDAGPGEDPLPNPIRALDFASGALGFAFPAPNLNSIRDAISANGPVILALNLLRNGQSAGTHFITATGILANGDLAISDANPQFALTRLSQYTTGFGTAAGNWIASPVAALQLVPRLPAPAFYAFSTSTFHLNSPAMPCSSRVSWPATFADLTSTASATNISLQFCDGSAASYQAAVSSAPFLLTVVSLSNPPARSILSAASPTAYRISRSASDSWLATPEQISISSGAILNAASFSPQLAPGTIFSLFGNGLPLQSDANSTIELNGASLPVIFSNGFQLNSAIPEATPPGPANLTVRSPFGQVSVPIELADAAPALFVFGPWGSAAALNQDFTVNSAANPVPRGQAIVLFATGLGAVTPAPGGLSIATSSPTVLVNQRELRPFFSGLAPGFIGLFQLNVLIPTNFPPGLELPVLVRSGSAISNQALISIR
ncbi:MAG: hypothetical protein FJW36_26070, partial [Acidobacteria bacterium]|nr:hypothetical protein [Acidobacteriota bacterium]